MDSSINCLGICYWSSSYWNNCRLWKLAFSHDCLGFAIRSCKLNFIFFCNSEESNQNQQAEKEPFFEGCKKAFSNRSAVAILFVTMFSMAEGSIGFYAISFFRQHFRIGITLGSIVIVTGNILASVGGVVAGLLINRVGQKTSGNNHLFDSGSADFNVHFYAQLFVILEFNCTSLLVFRNVLYCRRQLSY